jgi:phosphoribosylformylglycinamidine synthase
MTDQPISRFKIPALEMERIRTLLGREPNITEEAVFSALWSEHCSYKSSRVHLRNFSSRGPRVLMGPGENAGVVRVTEKTGIAFKMESHNHPSYIEPFQGAATGVGGILRDIFAMGARPVALTNSLVFGSLRQPRQLTLFRRVVAGISAYGNSIGVPTIGGEVWFDERYSKNILVNAFALGLVAEDGIMSAIPPKKTLVAVYLGNKTGRDGVSGAAMASRSFSGEDSDLRPQVQVADPFVGKKVMEATLLIIREQLSEAIQDMGAAGLTSSSVEMASKAGMGIELDVAQVPLRDFTMEPWEILLSESQERMLLLVEERHVGKILEIADDHQVAGGIIGNTIPEPVFRVRKGPDHYAEIPVSYLTDEAPLYERPTKARDSLRPSPSNAPSLAGSHSITELFHLLLEHPNGASTEWISRQFDYEVGTRTILPPGHDVAVVDLKEDDHAVAISMAGTSHPLSKDPEKGAMLLVAKCVSDLAAIGAYPVGLTDCLNFGNPERPATMSDFVLAVKGIAQACKRLQIPVVSGNVSFYNETDGLSIPPTPILATCGVLADKRTLLPGRTDLSGLTLALVGSSRDLALGGSYLDWVLALPDSSEPVPEVDWNTLERLQPFMSALAFDRRLVATRSVGRGGLLRSLLQIVSGSDSLGVALSLPHLENPLQTFFSESPGRIVLAYFPEHERIIERMALEFGIPWLRIGTTAQSSWTIRYKDRDRRTKILSDHLGLLKRRFATSLSNQMEEFS